MHPRARTYSRNSFIAILSLVASTGAARAAESHPGMNTEAEMAEASVLYNTKDYHGAIRLLDRVLKDSPNQVEPLELKALALKGIGNEKESLETYLRLIRLKPSSQRGPYMFESGLIYYRQKKLPEAKAMFEGALAGNFNVVPSHFFLGSMAFNSSEYSTATTHFKEVAKDKGNELSVAAHYYLGLIAYRGGNSTIGMAELTAARDGAKNFPQSKMATDIGAAAVKALTPTDVSHWFGNLSFMAQYDGNVALLSPTISAPDQVSGKKSVEAIVSGGFGRMSSSADPLQWIASYRFNYNYNFNSQAKGYEYFTNLPALYLNVNPSAPSGYGIKLEGNFGFQNTQSSTDSTVYTLRPYNLSGDLGPYIRTLLFGDYQTTFELVYRPQKYYQDGTDSTVRSGFGIVPKISARKDFGSNYLNPEASVTYEFNQAQGVDYQSRTFSLDLSDSLKLPGGNLLIAGATVAFSRFPNHTVATRSDNTFSFRINWIKDVGHGFSLLANAAYSSNKSTLDTVYSYAKPVLAFGATYSF